VDLGLAQRLDVGERVLDVVERDRTEQTPDGVDDRPLAIGDLSGGGLDYAVGDSFGIFARNDLGNVDQIIALLGASHTTKVRGKTLREVLLDDVSLPPAPDSLFELISYLTGGKQREKARALAQGEDPDGDAATLDVMAVLQKFPNGRPHPEAFIEAREARQPRLK